MPKKLVSILKVLISVLIAGVLLYLVFKNIDWIEFWGKAKQVEYSWVIASILISILGYILRAYRWNLLLEPMGYKLSLYRTMLAVLIGYLANLALPRLGEITRCGVMNKNDDVAVSKALGSVVSERIIDVLTLLVLIILGLILESERLISFLKTSYSSLELPSYTVWIVGIVVIGIGIALFIFIRNQRSKGGKFINIINDFIDGVLSLKDIKNPIGFILSTVAMWIVYFFMSYLIVFTIPETSHLDLSAGLLLLITGAMALTLPVQSGFGAYHGMVAGMLALYAIDNTTGVFLATLLHTSQIISIAFFGSIALLISFSIRKKNHVSNQE